MLTLAYLVAEVIGGLLTNMTDRLAERFGIQHTTIQLEVRNRRHAEPTH